MNSDELAWMTDPAPSITTMSITLSQARRRSMSRVPPIASANVSPMSKSNDSSRIDVSLGRGPFGRSW